jgi:hypothetical protein
MDPYNSIIPLLYEVGGIIISILMLLIPLVVLL